MDFDIQIKLRENFENLKKQKLILNISNGISSIAHI